VQLALDGEMYVGQVGIAGKAEIGPFGAANSSHLATPQQDLAASVGSGGNLKG